MASMGIFAVGSSRPYISPNCNGGGCKGKELIVLLITVRNMRLDFANLGYVYAHRAFM